MKQSTSPIFTYYCNTNLKPKEKQDFYTLHFKNAFIPKNTSSIIDCDTPMLKSESINHR